MKKKMMQRIVAFMLIMAMGISMAACGKTEEDEKDNSVQMEYNKEQEENKVVVESKYPEELNMESAYPIIKDEYADDITLRMVIVQDSTANSWEDTWLSQYFSNKYNMNFEVESIPSTALSERKNLLFNSGDLPDIILNLGLSNTELYAYGQIEGLLLKLDEYISEELTPGLYYFLYGEGGRSDALSAATLPDGHIYSLPRLLNKDNPALCSAVYINEATVNEVGAELPRTLDEFTQLMYDIKEADLIGIGSENVYPIGGGIDGNAWYILNAFGYLTTNGYGYSPAVRNGEMVVPVYDDMEVFQEYLKLMNQYYNDGIINPNYFTIEDTEIKAQLLGGVTSVYKSPVYVQGVENWDDWAASYPLTSEWNDTPSAKKSSAVGIGNLCISAETEYPEVCMRFMDIFYNVVTDDPMIVTEGALSGAPNDSGEYDYGFEPLYVYDSEAELGMAVNPNIGADNAYNYKVEERTGFYISFGAFTVPEAEKRYAENAGVEYIETELDPTADGDSCYRVSVMENVEPYVAEIAFPSVYYLDDETNQKLTDLAATINPYVKEQVALFITGERSLSETQDFVGELKSMGMDELVDIYRGIFDNYLATLN